MCYFTHTEMKRVIVNESSYFLFAFTYLHHGFEVEKKFWEADNEIKKYNGKFILPLYLTKLRERTK